MTRLNQLLVLVFSLLLLNCASDQLISKRKSEAKNYQPILGKMKVADNINTMKSTLSLENEFGDKENQRKKPQKVPMYPNGQDGLKRDIANNYVYPKKVEGWAVSGQVMIEFIIDKKGNIDNAQVVKKLHPLLDKEAIRAVKKLDQFMPGFVNNEPVKVLYTLPIDIEFIPLIYSDP